MCEENNPQGGVNEIAEEAGRRWAPRLFVRPFILVAILLTTFAVEHITLFCKYDYDFKKLPA